MAETYLTLTNKVLARLNEVELTSSTFSSARGIQTQVKTAINEAVRYINQREFNYPFNHATESKTLTAGVVRYSLPIYTLPALSKPVVEVRDKVVAESECKPFKVVEIIKSS